jgi:small subunit ribosomal protein S16
MVKIRLSRFGKRNTPFFRLVVTPAREKRESKFLENVGHYSPLNKEVVLKEDRIKYWLSVGAQPTDTVKYMLVKNGLMEATVSKKVYTKQPGKKATERKDK